MARILRISFDELPPSDNHIRDIKYIFAGGKRRAVIGYTKQAEDYKKNLCRHINDHYFLEVQKFARAHTPERVYLLSGILCFPAGELLTQGWLKVRNGQRAAKSPYMKLDTTNRRKLIEDCISESIGIDDSLFWEAHLVKMVGSTPRLELVLEEMDPRDYGVPEAYLGGLRER